MGRGINKPLPATRRELKAQSNKKAWTRIASRLSLVPVVGLEPTRYRYQRILSPSRLPFHHTGKLLIYYTPVCTKNQEGLQTFFQILPLLRPAFSEKDEDKIK